MAKRTLMAIGAHADVAVQAAVAALASEGLAEVDGGSRTRARLAS